MQPGAASNQELFPYFAQFVLERYTQEIKDYRCGAGGGGGRGGALAAGQAAIPHSAEPLAPRDVVGVLLSCAKRCPRAACCSDMIKSVDLRQPHQWFPMARALQRR